MGGCLCVYKIRKDGGTTKTTTECSRTDVMPRRNGHGRLRTIQHTKDRISINTEKDQKTE